jgi:hypothetical protein
MSENALMGHQDRIAGLATTVVRDVSCLVLGVGSRRDATRISRIRPGLLYLRQKEPAWISSMTRLSNTFSVNTATL